MPTTSVLRLGLTAEQVEVGGGLTILEAAEKAGDFHSHAMPRRDGRQARRLPVVRRRDRRPAGVGCRLSYAASARE